MTRETETTLPAAHRAIAERVNALIIETTANLGRAVKWASDPREAL